MKHESRMWREVRPALIAAKLDPMRVENPIHPGTPDVNLCTGDWIELKTIAGWPGGKRKVLLPHFTPQQRVWLYKRWKFAPRSTHLLLEVRSTREYLLYWGDVAAKIVGRLPENDHRVQARAIFQARDLEKLGELFGGSATPQRSRQKATQALGATAA